MNTKKINKLILILIAMNIVLVYGVIISALVTNDRRSQTRSDQVYALCKENEGLSYIPQGSCECAKKLFPNFEESYDWMDACMILESKK